ncbi:MAG: DNA-protecting protein DprA [Leptospiraceae bacterium]|nr:DNA-protecting protein DprA [Leptospiraceae bacterium]
MPLPPSIRELQQEPDEMLFRLKLACVVSSLPYRRSFFQLGGFARLSKSLRKWPEHLLALFGEDIVLRGMLQAKSVIPLLQESFGFHNPAAREMATSPNAVASVQVLFFSEEAYPVRLRNIYDSPGVLWIRSFEERSAPLGSRNAAGDSREGMSNSLQSSAQSGGGLPPFEDPVAGIVGTRDPEPVSLVATEELVEGLPESALIVSGLARGIDERAHRCALLRGLATVAVLGAGILCPGPSSNRHLWQRRYPGKLWLVSEFLPHQPARSYHFPRRNRIIAGLCDSLYLMQAPDKSGALISAAFALEEGRELFAFDHPLLQKPGANEGARDLIQQGARGLELCSEQRLLRISRGPVQLEREIFERDGLRSGRLRPLGQGWLFDSG